LYNQYDNRLYRVKKHPTGCLTGCQTALTNRLDVCLHDIAGCSFNRLSNRVAQPGWQQVVPCYSCKWGFININM